MASKSSNLVHEAVHKEIETWSVYKCVFCNTLLDDKSKILDCLHAICINCMNKKIQSTGLQCKCLSVTKNVTIDYPLASTDIPENTSKSKVCDNSCETVASRMCVVCDTFYCKPCSEVHVSSHKDHCSSLILPYPINNNFISCSTCSKKSIDIYCTICSVVLCSLCFLNLHRKHSYKLIDTYCEEIQASLSEKSIELKKSNACLVFCVDQTKKQIHKMETEKTKINNEIDVVMQKLHDKLNMRVFELKKLVAHNFTDSIDKMHANRKLLLDTQKKIRYYIQLAQTIMEHKDFHDFIILSKMVLKHLDEQNEVIDGVSGLNIDLKYSSDESDGTLENCISAIKNVGNFTSVSVPILSEIYGKETPKNTSQHFINLQAINFNDKRVIREEVLNSSVDFGAESDSSDYEPLVECSCCNQLAEKLIQCNSCSRHFHNDCHIPALLQDMNVCNSPSQMMWKCTLCQDITKYAKVLNQKDMNGSILVSKTELKIMERILMELYCQNNDSEHYRECPSEELYPVYYQKVHSPLSLNDVKNNFESESYTDLIQFLKDLRKVFLNGFLYYPPDDPYHDSATNLLTSLNRLISKWIPKLDEIMLR